jgi:putative addiction module component (TIGR02574 family)
MTDEVAELAALAESLSPVDRIRLVDMLLVSLQEPATAEVEAAWEAEIDRRLDEVERREVTAIPAEDVFAKARSIAM